MTSNEAVKKWKLPEDGQGGYLYCPYGRFGPTYRVPNETAKAKLLTNLQMTTFVPSLCVLLLRFLPDSIHSFPLTFFTVMALYEFALLWGIAYVVAVRHSVKGFAVAEEKLPFRAAFCEEAYQSKPKTLLIVQGICLALAGGAFLLSQSRHADLAIKSAMWIYAITFIGIAIACLAMNLLRDRGRVRSEVRQRVAR